MNKRKVSFNDVVDVKKYKNEEPEIENQDDLPSKRVLYAFKNKHSLDSDEEDYLEDSKKMGYNDIEGQENDTIAQYDTIEITPFNMREEMDEGKFDENGNFIFNKKAVEIRDNWIDNINWVEVKERATISKSIDDQDSQEESKTADEIHSIYAAMLELLLPGENILKALRRIGKKISKDPLIDKFSSSASARLKFKKEQRKKAEVTTNEENGKCGDEVSQNDLLKLTGLADELLQNGIYDIYEHTYEKLAHLTKQQTPNEQIDSVKNLLDNREEIIREKAVDSNLDMFEGID